MTLWQQYLLMVPILVPLFSATVLILLSERHHRLKFGLNLVTTLVVLAAAAMLLWQVDSGTLPLGIGLHFIADWPAPFGIVLLVDRLSALMVLMASGMAVCALLYAESRWSRIGVHFHSLFQFLLMGMNGAFLTHDLFNLFVFFEVMLAASYGLVLHGYNSQRLRAGLHYIVINLVASFFFLIGVSLLYAATGTLNMTDMAMQIATLSPDDYVLLKVGCGILVLAFLTKGAAWPLGFWLPQTYAAASPPVAAMLVLMTKIGLYAVLRLWLLLFADAPAVLQGFGGEFLLWSGMATIAFGTFGMLASQEPAPIAGYGAIISSGILLSVVSFGDADLLAGALFYLIGSTLAIAAFMLLTEIVNRLRTPASAMLALTMEAFAVEDKPSEPVGVVIPAALAFLGIAFIGCALMITGFPPLSGFIAKFSLLRALVELASSGIANTLIWLLIVLIVVSGLTGIISLMRFGVRTFWATNITTSVRLSVSEAVPIVALLLVFIGLTVQAGQVMGYLERTADGLLVPQHYQSTVMDNQVATRASGGDT
uniref:monovalent cation/H+ antiporter subunit D n=1 Tax=Halomonas sp. TaxID=1486246 RepID=UPI00260EBE96|nr:monovalent cation/H+ antiporter subunit D [Halomonas sp.]